MGTRKDSMWTTSSCVRVSISPLPQYVPAHWYHTLKQLRKPESIARIMCALVHKYPYLR